MYKQLIAVHLASAFLVYAAGNAWSDRISRAAQLDRMGQFTESGALYGSLVDEARTFAESDVRRSEAFNNAASHSFYIGDYAKAERLYSDALRAYKDAGETDNAKLSSMLANLAALYRTQARFADAEQTALRAVAVNPTAPNGWTNLAEIYRVESKLDEAEAAARKGIELIPAQERDGRLHTLAAILRDRKQFADALSLYERSLKFQQAHYTVAAATTLANIAELYLREGDYPKAEAAANRALEIWRSGGVRATPNMAATLNNLAQIRKLQGRYAEAEPLYRDALTTWEASVGNRHPEYAKGLSNLADFYHAIGNDRAAEQLYRRAAAILSSMPGTSTAAAVEVTSRRVEVLNALGRYTDAQRVASSAVR